MSRHGASLQRRSAATFIRVEKIGQYECLHLAQDAREGGRHLQKVISKLGRRDDIENSDLLDGLDRVSCPTFAAVERVVDLTVPHRLMVSGFDRYAALWRETLEVPGADAITLDHPCKAMAWQHDRANRNCAI